MRTIVMLLVLALAGCSDPNDWSNDDSAILLMGATAFTNGYNQARQPPMLMCFNTGSIVMCQ